MASLNYTSFFYDGMIGNVDVNTDTFYGMLVTATYTPNKDHTKRSDITNEVVGAGYTSEGKAVTLTPTLDAANDRVEIAIGSVNWPAATITARAMVIYKRRGGLATADELVCYLDFEANVTSTAGTFTVTPSTPIRINN